MVRGYRSVVVGVSDLDQSLGLFRDVMALRVEHLTTLAGSLMTAWGLPANVTAREAELSCKGYPYGRLRLVEYRPNPSTRIRADFGPMASDSPLDIGPKAIDFYVADPIGPSLARVMAAGYRPRSEPRRHQIGQTISEEVVISGPDELPVLLMVGHRHAPTSLRAGSPDGPFSEIATSSVICGDLAGSRRFYGDWLGLKPVNDAETPEQYRDLVCELVGAPPGTRIHFLLYAEPGQASGKTLLIHFVGVPPVRLRHPMGPGQLGFSLFEHDADDLDNLHARAAAAKVEVLMPPTNVDTPQGSRRIMLVRGPNGEVLQLGEA